MRAAAALCFSIFLLAQTVAAEEIFVLITEPVVNQTVFGQIDIEAEVSPEGVDAKVEFWVDGDLVGIVDEKPYRISVDVGQENRERELSVRALGPAGQVAEARLVTPAIPIDEVVKAELQQLYVTVVGAEGRELGLGDEDFEVRDNGRVQELVTFTAGHVPLAAAVLIDASASMKGRRLGFALRGATAFASGVEPEDEVSIQLFADKLLYESPFSSDIEVSTAGLAGVEAEGGTSLNDYLYRALRQLESRQGRRVVVLLSDGIDNHSALRMEEVTWFARRSRAMIYWVRTGSWGNDRHRFSSWKNDRLFRQEYTKLQETVEESGGRVIGLDSVEQAATAMREILQELREQYVLGYYPSLSRNDGSWHRVNVRVKGGGYVVRTRDGYVDY